MDCVSVGPPGPEVMVRELDLDWRAPESRAQDLVLMDQQYAVDDHVTFRRVVERLNTLQAVQARSQWQMDFDPATEKVTVHWLRVHRAGEVIDHTDPTRFRCLQREENLERCIIDGGANLLVLLEDIRPGDVLDTAVTIRTTPRLMRDHFSYFGCVSYPMHVGQLFISFRSREDRPLNWKSNIPALVPIETTGDGVRELRWERRGIKPFSMEENVPSWYLPGGWIQVSDFASWQEVARGLHAAWSTHSSLAELEATLERIRASVEDLEGQVEQAIRFVQDDIRYLSVNVELGGQVPSAPGTVVRRRFGDCKDKALLLTRLLQAMGLQAHPLLVHTRLRRDLKNWLPSPLFDHAIITYQLDGVWYSVDATIPLQGGGPARRPVPRYSVGLVVTDEGVTGLQPVETPPGSDGRLRLEERFEVDPSGGPGDLFVKLQVTGAEADRIRAAIHHHGVDGLARDREQFYRSMHPGLARLGTIEWRDDRMANALTLAERYELPDRQETLPGLRQHFVEHAAHAITAFLPGTIEVNRKRPYQLPYPIHVEQIVEVTSPSLPMFNRDNDSAYCPEFSFTHSITPSMGTVRAAFQLELHAEEVPAEGMARYMEALKRVYRRRDMSIKIPRSRNVLYRRGDEPLLDEHDATVAMVEQDIKRETEALRHASKAETLWTSPSAKRPPLAAATFSDPSLDSPPEKIKKGIIPNATPATTLAPAPAPAISPAPRSAPARARAEAPPAAAAAAPAPALSAVPAPAPLASTLDELADSPAKVSPAQVFPATPTAPNTDSGRRRSGRSRSKKGVSKNVKMSLWGCGIFLLGFPLLTWVGLHLIDDTSQPEAAAYQAADDLAWKDPYLDEAYRLYFLGDVLGARARFDGVAGKYPLSLRVNALGVRLAVAEGQLDSAETLLAKWQQLYPTDPELQVIQVELLLAKGKSADAVNLAASIAGMPKAPPSTLFLLARAHLAAGQAEQAEPLLRQFLEQEGADHRARYLLGSVYQKTGRPGDIEKLWQEALAAFPQDDAAAMLAGQQLAEAGLKEEAARTLDAAAQRLPNSARIAHQQATLLKAEGKAQQAFDLFQRAAQLDPSWVDPALNAALILEAAGHAETLKAYQIAADRSPQEAPRLILTGRSVAQFSARGSQIFFERALLLNKDAADAWELLAKTHEALGNPDKAASARRRDSTILPKGN